MTETVSTLDENALESWQDGLRRQILEEWTLGLVQRAIWCPYTKSILDIRTCHVMIDHEGTPEKVISPEVTETARRSDLFGRLANTGHWIIARDADGEWQVQS